MTDSDARVENVTQQKIADTDDPNLVWAVTGNYADDPHPHVLAVYDNEEAAKEHSKAIRDSIKPSEPVAWGVTEMKLDSDPLRERRSKVDV